MCGLWRRDGDITCSETAGLEGAGLSQQRRICWNSGPSAGGGSALSRAMRVSLVAAGTAGWKRIKTRDGETVKMLLSQADR